MSEQPQRSVPIETPCGQVSQREAGYLLSLQKLIQSGARPTQAALARAVGVSAPTTLEMVRRLRQLGLVEEDGLALTHRGTSAALALASRQHAAHLLTHDILGLADDGQADVEAARLAPNVSPNLARHLLAAERARER